MAKITVKARFDNIKIHRATGSGTKYQAKKIKIKVASARQKNVVSQKSFIN